MENQNTMAIDNNDASLFTFVQKDQKLSDVNFKTKKIGYFRDALSRFTQNKGSIVAGVIILFLIMFSIVTPFFSGYGVNEMDPYYTDVLPKSSFGGNGFWDGTGTIDLKEPLYYNWEEKGCIRSVNSTYESHDEDTERDIKVYSVTYDSYKVGYSWKQTDKTQLDDILAYDSKITVASDKVLAPLVDTSWISSKDTTGLKSVYENDANYCYKMSSGSLRMPTFGTDGKKQYCYMTDSEGNYVYYKTMGLTSSTYQLRVNYDNYYKYAHNGRSPLFVLGSDQAGRDIMTRLAVGGRISLILGFCVALVNIILGVIYGAIEGYYGGTADIVMERISEILSEIPFIIVVTLFQLYLVKQYSVSPVISLFVAFVATGWIGTAATVRMQFYRFKNQEYVLAARTLGARDSRLIFRHILPNSLGTIITSTVLMIPSVIFSESSLSYLGIINFATSNLTSIGTMLSEGQKVYSVYPNVILWPALFISILMICFNIFGNGLRDAFNPQLRGAE